MSVSLRGFCAALCAVVVVTVLGCGEDSGDGESGSNAAPCDPGQEGAGVNGRVAVPSCDKSVPFAEVVLLDQLQFEVATTTANANGEFSFGAGQLPSDGVYVLTARKGPFSGPDRPEPFEVASGRSSFQLIFLATE